MNKISKIIIFCTLLGIVSLQSFAIKPDRNYRFYPEKLGLIYRDLDVKTSDGLKIKTWFFPAQPALSEKELDMAWKNSVRKTYRTIDDKRRPTIIIANGDAGNMSYQQLVYSQYFTNTGYNVVTFDWRGFGESSEWKMNTDYLAYSELLIDYDAVIKAVLQQKEVDTSALVVFGWSTGAYLSMAAASKYDNIKAFVAIGLMTTFDEAYPVLKKVSKNANRNLIIPSDYPLNLQPLMLAPKWNKATFLIVGELDDRSPVWMSEKIYAKLSSKKELWIVKDTDHSMMKKGKIDFASLNKRIMKFLEKNMK
ncbi:alpha/beta fold hydrolase [Dysgonomonas sp. Marseille-P4677]|uniref:alpha/beta hydrolase family protein n=1 Tax=Dysgonomonas sp. Marseille-P4677 TaxID=2364790 RepID=UPI0019146DEB|nr:alpha/beta fold hydrolase [Dysgonomonas sp. Marseille-P4677]MBK5722863.1 alpha/beta fold hydrolase [Dysgonomonas sp. Marseille-P4677]